jgi:hypothetical protein
LQWRLVGDADWIDLAETPVCEPDAPPLPNNSAQARCGVAVAVTAALAAAYRRAKLDSDNWDTLQGLSAQAAAAGTSVNIAAAAAGTVFGTGLVLSGIGLIGGVIAGAGTFLAGILALTNDNTDYFTAAVEEDLAQALYCVLSRRETTAITTAALREWISYIADAGLPAADLDIILGILAWMPVGYWQNEATVAPPKINPCSMATCPNRDIEFSYEFNAEPVPGTIQLLKPLAAAMMTLNVGERDVRGIAASPAPLNTRQFSVTVNLGRIVPVTGIELEVFYNQTSAVTSPVLSLQAENILETRSVTGTDDGFVSLRWSGLESIDRFTVTGIVGSNGDFDDLAALELFRVKICGFGWPTFGQSNDTGEHCEYDPCIDDLGIVTDHCYTWDFRSSDGGWTAPLFGGSTSTWVLGEGWKSSLRVTGFDQTDELRINLGFTSSFNRSLVYIEIEGEFVLGQMQFGGGDRGRFRMRDGTTSTDLLNVAGPFDGIVSDSTPPPANTFRSGIQVIGIASQRTSGTPNPRGSITLSRVTVKYNGDDANLTGGEGY